jgi:ABC-type uncharacterized transport system involved in gliding motility auxiliary subunit
VEVNMDKIKASKLFFWSSVTGFMSTGFPYIVGIWFPFMYGVLALTLISFGIWIYLNQQDIRNVIFDKNTYWNSRYLGSIALALVIAIGCNFLATKYNHSIDITSDKINTLSQESLKIVAGLKENVYLKVYYTEKSPAQIRLMLKKLFSLYEKESKKISSQFLNAKWDPAAAEYLTKDDQDQVVVFVETQKGKERVSEPISEETITTALIRLQSSTKYKVYFTTGHGEKSIADDAPTGISELKKDLNSRGLEAASLSLLNLKNGEMPLDLFVLVIAGPMKSFSVPEIDIIKGFLEDGGKLVLAVDPEFMTGFNELFKNIGVELKDHFVVSVQSTMPLFVLGSEFNKNSDITSEFLNSQVLFPISGSIYSDPKKIPKNVEIQTLVSTNQYAFSAANPTEVQRVLQKISEQGTMEGKSFDLAVLIEGKNPEIHNHLHEGHSHSAKFKKGDGFGIVLFSDSDFMSNEHIPQFYNKDLILNSVVYLTGQKDLISIRPNQAKATTIDIGSMGLNIGALMSFFPFLFFGVWAIALWFKKRSM